VTGIVLVMHNVFHVAHSGGPKVRHSPGLTAGILPTSDHGRPGNPVLTVTASHCRGFGPY